MNYHFAKRIQIIIFQKFKSHPCNTITYYASVKKLF